MKWYATAFSLCCFSRSLGLALPRSQPPSFGVSSLHIYKVDILVRGLSALRAIFGCGRQDKIIILSFITDDFLPSPCLALPHSRPVAWPNSTVTYAGKALEPDTSYTWQVQTWTQTAAVNGMFPDFLELRLFNFKLLKSFVIKIINVSHVATFSWGCTPSNPSHRRTDKEIVRTQPPFSAAIHTWQ